MMDVLAGKASNEMMDKQRTILAGDFYPFHKKYSYIYSSHLNQSSHVYG